MKNTLLLTCMIMLSFSLVGQSTTVIDHFGYQNTSFVNNGWYINGELISLSQQNFNGIGAEQVISEEQSNKTLEITYGHLTQQFQSEIKISKKLSDGYTDLSVEISITEITQTSINSIDLIEYDDNGNMITTYNNINTQKFDISNNTDSLLIVVNVSINTIKTFQFGQIKIYGDLITNIQENIANNFNVYSYNKNLVIKTTALENYSIRIYNLSGQEVLVKNAQGNQDIPLTLATGMYIVNINNGKESFNQKVVMQ